MPSAPVRRGSVMSAGQRLNAGVHRTSKKINKRKAKNPRRKKKGFKLLFILFVAIVLLCVGFISWKLYMEWINRHWIYGARMTVVVALENPKIYSYDPQTKKITSMEIPSNTQIETSNGYGTWLVGGLWGLGNQEGQEGKLLKDSLQKTLGIPVDAWIEAKGDNLFESNTLGWFDAALGAISAGKVKTDLTFFDRLGMLSKSVGTATSDRQEIDLVETGILKKTKLSDGTEGYIIVPEKAKVIFSQIADTTVYGEALKVVIVNTTTKSGLAGNVAQTATILGARVINTKNISDKVDDCLVRGTKDKLESLTAQRFVQIFGCETEKTEAKGGEDLEIVLGQKFAERY